MERLVGQLVGQLLGQLVGQLTRQWTPFVGCKALCRLCYISSMSQLCLALLLILPNGPSQ